MTCGQCACARKTDSPDLVALVKPCPYAGLKTDKDDPKTCNIWKPTTKEGER